MDEEDASTLLGEVVEAHELMVRERVLALTWLKLHHVAIVEAHLSLREHL